MPYFVIGMPLIIIFADVLHWFPTSGMLKLGARVHIGPSTSSLDFLAPPHAAADDGVARADRPVLDPHALVDHRDRSARTTSRRPGRRACRDRGSCAPHAFPNALLPTVTLIAINLGYVVAGAITVEVVFNWPGLGTLTVDALDGARLPGPAGRLPAPVDHRRPRQPVADLLYGVPRPAGPVVTAAARRAAGRLPRRALAPAGPVGRARSSASSRAGRTASSASSILVVFAILALAPAAVRRAAPDRDDRDRRAVSSRRSRRTSSARTSSAGTSST